jgi:uncharacterized membrane protein
MHELLLTVHILAAIIWLGGAVMMHILGRRTLARGNGQEIHTFSTEINAIGGRLYPAMSIVLLIAGVLLVSEAGYDFGSLWITLAFVGWGLSFLIGVGYYGPQGKKLDALVAEQGPLAPGVAANVRSALTVNQVELLILFLVAIDMTVKPGL